RHARISPKSESLSEPLEYIKRIPKLDGHILLNKPGTIERLVLLPIHRKLHSAPAKRESHDPVQLRGVRSIAGIPVGEKVRIAIEDHFIFIEIQVCVGHVSKQ